MAVALSIPKGTKALVIKDGKEWRGDNFHDYVTTKNLMFFREEIAVDPVGSLGACRHHAVTIGGDIARKGYYGFRRDGYVLLVHFNDVTGS